MFRERATSGWTGETKVGDAAGRVSRDGEAMHRASRPSKSAPWLPVVLMGGGLVGVGLMGVNGSVSALGLCVQIVFVVFFARHFAFAISAMRSAPVDLAAPVVDGGFLPSVSVLVGCRDEEPVIEGLVESILALDYPPDRLQLIVVDDGSLDRTGANLDSLAARDPRLRVLHRPRRAGGGKSGALNAGLEIATGEVIVVFDADHRPRPDVVRRLVRHLEDPGVGAVQGRCEIGNPGDSPLSQIVAIDYMAGYLVNEYGRQSLFQLPAYGGANCAVRASSLRASGGWNEDSVTEDTDLTLRLVLRGERVRYDVTAVDEEEAVTSFRHFWRQRYRWARGHQQVWRDYRRAAWDSPFLTAAQKVETTLFLLVFHVPIASALGLLIVTLWLAGLAQPVDPLHAFVLWTLLFLGPLAELGGGLLISGCDRRKALSLVFFLPVFLVSVAVCTKAWLDGVTGRPYGWVKTGRSPVRGPRVAR
jgi:1,2-diacylglycerol 3-beta-glucosyltransferase